MPTHWEWQPVNKWSKGWGLPAELQQRWSSTAVQADPRSDPELLVPTRQRQSLPYLYLQHSVESWVIESSREKARRENKLQFQYTNKWWIQEFWDRGAQVFQLFRKDLLHARHTTILSLKDTWHVKQRLQVMEQIQTQHKLTGGPPLPLRYWYAETSFFRWSDLSKLLWPLFKSCSLHPENRKKIQLLSDNHIKSIPIWTKSKWNETKNSQDLQHVEPSLWKFPVAHSNLHRTYNLEITHKRSCNPSSDGLRHLLSMKCWKALPQLQTRMLVNSQMELLIRPAQKTQFEVHKLIYMDEPYLIENVKISFSDFPMRHSILLQKKTRIERIRESPKN